jgi:hypothetical protein
VSLCSRGKKQNVVYGTRQMAAGSRIRQKEVKDSRNKRGSGPSQSKINDGCQKESKTCQKGDIIKRLCEKKKKDAYNHQVTSSYAGTFISLHPHQNTAKQTKSDPT